MESFLEPEFKPHFEAWQQQPDNPMATGKFLTALSPVLDSALRSYGGKSPSPTLRSRAKLMALDAARRYDPTRAKLRTHLMTHLQGLRRLSAREGQIISIPERVGLDLHHLHMAETELKDTLGRDPSDAELADHAGMSLRRLTHIRKARPGFAESQITTASDEGDVAFNPAVVSRNDDAWLNFIRLDLHPIDQIIMDLSLGLNGNPKLTKQRIAAKLKLSTGAISQRAAKIQALINKREELGSFL